MDVFFTVCHIIHILLTSNLTSQGYSSMMRKCKKIQVDEKQALEKEII